MRRMACLVVVSIVSGTPGRGRSRAEPAADPTAKARLKPASEAYGEVFDTIADLCDTPPGGADLGGEEATLKRCFNRARAEEFYKWSRRWMEAERDLNPDNPVAALSGRLNRMKRLGVVQVIDYIQKRPDGAMSKGTDALKGDQVFPSNDPGEGPDFTKSVKFFRLEAEAWLAKASAPRPG